MNTKPTENPYRTTDMAIVGDIYTSRSVLEHLYVLCDDCGSRFAGTPGEKQAADYILSTFERYGLENCRLEEFAHHGWTRGPAQLKVTAPAEKELTCISLPYCPAGEVKGKLVDVDMGTPDDFDRLADEIRGNIALVSSKSPHNFGRWIHRKEKFDRSVVAGAAAFIFISEIPGVGPETGSLQNDSPAPIPGISVALEDGEYLRRLVKRKGEVNLHLTTTDVNEPRTSWNVIGDLVGSEGDSPQVILGSHYDGHDIAQGALDPASGTVVVLEAARVLAAHRRDWKKGTIRFIAFGSEELGLTGSHRYVADHMDDMDSIRLYFNLDSAGTEGRKGITVNHWDELETYFEEMVDEMASDIPVGQKLHAYSDHFPFFLQGVPTIYMGDPFRPPSGRGYGHTHYDTVDKVELSDLREATSVAARIALRVVRDDDFPAYRRTGDEVEKIIQDDGNLEGYRVTRDLHRKIEEGVQGN